MDMVDKDEWTVSRPTAQHLLLKLNDTRNREKQTIMSRLHHTQQKLLQEQHWSRQVAQRCAELEDQVDRLEKENAHHVAKNISLNVQVASLQRRLIRRGPQGNLAEPPSVHGVVDHHMDGANKHDPSQPGKALRRKQSYTTSAINDKRFTRQHLSQHSVQHSGGAPLGSCSKATINKTADRASYPAERKRPVRDQMVPAGRALDHENMTGMASALPGHYSVQRPARSKVQPPRQQPSRTSTVTTATTPAVGTANIGEKSFDLRHLLLSAGKATQSQAIEDYRTINRSPRAIISCFVSWLFRSTLLRVLCRVATQTPMCYVLCTMNRRRRVANTVLLSAIFRSNSLARDSDGRRGHNPSFDASSPTSTTRRARARARAGPKPTSSPRNFASP